MIFEQMAEDLPIWRLWMANMLVMDVFLNNEDHGWSRWDDVAGYSTWLVSWMVDNINMWMFFYKDALHGWSTWTRMLFMDDLLEQ
jgi:hypothetical protein